MLKYVSTSLSNCINMLIFGMCITSGYKNHPAKSYWEFLFLKNWNFVHLVGLNKYSWTFMTIFAGVYCFINVVFFILFYIYIDLGWQISALVLIMASLRELCCFVITIYSCDNGIMGKLRPQKICVFPVTRPTLFKTCRPKTF